MTNDDGIVPGTDPGALVDRALEAAGLRAGGSIGTTSEVGEPPALSAAESGDFGLGELGLDGDGD